VLQHEINVSADIKRSRLKINYMLEDLKPLIEARIQEILRLSSAHPQRIRGNPSEVCVLGSQYRVGAK